MAAEKITSKQLGALLIERGVITQKQLERALAVQKDAKDTDKVVLLGEILVEIGFATEEDIAQALTCQYGFPYLPLKNYELDEGVIKIISEDIARRYCLIVIDKIGKNVTLAMSNPLNTEAIEAVAKITNCSVQTFVSTATDVKHAIERYYSGKR